MDLQERGLCSKQVLFRRYRLLMQKSGGRPLGATELRLEAIQAKIRACINTLTLYIYIYVYTPSIKYYLYSMTYHIMGVFDISGGGGVNIGGVDCRLWRNSCTRDSSTECRLQL